MENKTKKTILTYIIAIIIPLAVGGLASIITKPNMNIYDSVQKPPLAPPGILFPIVWGVLYILMGVSSAIVYLNREKDVKNADYGITIYATSLVFNFFWSIFFFNFEWFLLSFVWLIALLLLIIATTLYYKKISPLSAILQIPYIVWVTFAGYLNLAIYLLN